MVLQALANVSTGIGAAAAVVTALAALFAIYVYFQNSRL